MGRRATKCHLQGKIQLWQSWIHRPCNGLNENDPYKLVGSGTIRKYGPVGVKVVLSIYIHVLCIWLPNKKIQWKGCLYDWKKVDNMCSLSLHHHQEHDFLPEKPKWMCSFSTEHTMSSLSEPNKSSVPVSPPPSMLFRKSEDKMEILTRRANFPKPKLSTK